jgi:hypothetical protein
MTNYPDIYALFKEKEFEYGGITGINIIEINFYGGMKAQMV